MDTQTFDQLKKLVKNLTKELIEYGGTTPPDTCKIIAKEYPDFWAKFGPGPILQLVEELQYSELPDESARLQVVFRSFNEKYFGRRLSDFEMRAVYDVNFWSGENIPFPEGFVEYDRQRITIGYSGCGLGTVRTLHYMIYAAHPEWSELTSQDPLFLAEEDRLRALGAPVDAVFVIEGAF